MGFGAPGGFSIGPSSVQSNAEAGLPFANVPGDLADKVERELGREPEHPPPDVTFHQVVGDRRLFSLRSFLRPHAWWLAGGALLMLVEAALMNIGPLLTQIGIDEGIDQGRFDVIVTVVVLYLVAIVVSAAAGFVRASVTGRLGERLMYDLRVRVFSHFQRQSLDFFTSEKAGVLMTRMTSDIESLNTLFQEGLVQFVVQFLTLVVITAYLLILDVRLAVATIVLVVPVTVVLSLWFRRAAGAGYLRVRDRIADVLSDLQESLAGVRVIQAANRRAQNVQAHRSIVHRHRLAEAATARAQVIYGPGTEALGVAAQALVLLIGGRMVLRGALTIGEMTAFVLFLNRFFAPIQTLVQLFNQYQQGAAAVSKLQTLLATESSVSESADAHDLPPIEGEIRLRQVTFGYDATQPVLTDVDLWIHPGEVLAVVGPTGAGKSTVAKLITRFYDPQKGQVTIDDHDLTDVTLHSLRSQLGVVPQEPFLFNGSLRDNIAFARPSASDAEVAAAVEAVGLDALVSTLPRGVDSPVHERGTSLSAGERQLLALARAFLAGPRVLVLDEATSNLDLASETVVERALDKVLEGRTAIIIAHRLATAMRADRIAVIDEGRLVELGSHDELVAAGGFYAEMYRTYAGAT
ncbi:MAG: ABC transporter ATP-binding protein/permease [Acidimicrobiia bacterium]|nr:ABC transporter ATP-binding protein/permease [Acidimicrobiia bacterium]MDH5237585.1 ABC transporter ATP-binding protein/permease [Acidimicrobiia bacterium]